jgi:hypothetical protein
MLPNEVGKMTNLFRKLWSQRPEHAITLGVILIMVAGLSLTTGRGVLT